MASRNLLRYDQTMTNTRPTLIAAALITAAIGIPLAGPTITIANASPAIQEDDPRWDCRVNGDRVCGPTNDQGVPAGLYADNQLVTAWEPAWYGHPELVPAH